MTTAAPSSDDGYSDVLDASAILDELPDAARVEVWASSVLGVWGEDANAADIDEDFVQWLQTCDDTRAATVLLAVSDLLDVDSAIVELAQSRLPEPPHWFSHLGSAQPTRAWTVDQDEARSVGFGFVLSDHSEHSLLGDISEGELTALIVAPGPDELFDGAEDLVDPRPTDVTGAALELIAAWRTLAGRPVLPESVYVNGGIARARLAMLTGDDLRPLFRPVTEAVESVTGPTERAELDAWALAQLDMVGLGDGVEGADLLLDAIEPGRIATYPATEREAFEALEWADWLGMVIGLSRASQNVRVTPSALIDHINRCPEVTSSIPKNERPYYEWAVSLLLPLWRRARVLDEQDHLTTEGAAMLVNAIRSAWGQRS